MLRAVGTGLALAAAAAFPPTAARGHHSVALYSGDVVETR
jgi:hypothetical protein